MEDSSSASDAIPSSSSSSSSSPLHHTHPHQRQRSGGGRRAPPRINLTTRGSTSTSGTQQTIGGSDHSPADREQLINPRIPNASSTVAVASRTSNNTPISHRDRPLRADDSFGFSRTSTAQGSYSLARTNTDPRINVEQSNNRIPHSNSTGSLVQPSTSTGLSAESTLRNDSFQGGNQTFSNASIPSAQHMNQRYTPNIQQTHSIRNITSFNHPQPLFAIPSPIEPFPSLAHPQNPRGVSLASSRYLTERKRRISSLASSPEASDGRRQPGLLALDHSRDGISTNIGPGGNLGSPFEPNLPVLLPSRNHGSGRNQRAKNISNMAATSSSAPFPPSGNDWRSSSTHSSQRNTEVIDLTGDDDENMTGQTQSSGPHHHGQSQNRPGRSSSYRDQEILLPRWQPDSEVQNCPVCGKLFTMWYRKHHCRKCGRVVCSACSPHRITIPRQFIVHPPTTIDLTGSDDGNSPSTSNVPNQNIWGGEEVRVCNPCVPDPNYDPPQSVPPASHLLGRPLPPLPPLSPSSTRGQRAASTGQAQGGAPWFSFSSGSGLGTYGGSSIAANQGQGRGVLVGQSGPHHIPHQHPHQHSHSPFGYGQSAYHPPPPYQHSFGHQNSLHQQVPIGPSSAPTTQYRFRNPSSVRDLWPPTQPPTSSSALRPPQQQRRTIPEEDECPICQAELPPVGPNGETTAREQHVMDCISAASGGTEREREQEEGTETRRRSERNTGRGEGGRGLPPQRAGGPAVGAEPIAPTRPLSMVAAAMAASPGMPERGGPSSRRLTGSRLIYYIATEKDCLGDGGEKQECIICFEEFEVGVEMARLECWCKFHKACIRDWFATKGQGSCPTHQLHD